MKCDKCNREREKGKTYIFHYGNQLGPQQIKREPLAKTITTHYSIKGTREAWICRQCYLESFITSPFIVFFLIPIVVFWGVAAESSNPLIVMLFGIGLSLVFAFMMQIANYGPFSIYGDNVAIKAHRDSLKAQGYDSFFNRHQAQRIGYQRPPAPLDASLCLFCQKNLPHESANLSITMVKGEKSITKTENRCETCKKAHEEFVPKNAKWKKIILGLVLLLPLCACGIAYALTPDYEGVGIAIVAGFGAGMAGLIISTLIILLITKILNNELEKQGIKPATDFAQDPEIIKLKKAGWKVQVRKADE